LSATKKLFYNASEKYYPPSPFLSIFFYYKNEKEICKEESFINKYNLPIQNHILLLIILFFLLIILLKLS
jgi:hypothetical protein